MKTRYIFPAFLSLMGLLLWGCTKEEAMEPKADFTLNLVDNVGYVMEDIVMHLENSQGDFLTYFTGDGSNKIYHPDSALVVGNEIDKSVDSVIFEYRNAGTFQFTLLATSLGNWAEDYLTDSKTVEVTIIDRRTGFRSFKIDNRDGEYSEDRTHYYYYAAKGVDLTAKKPIWKTDSPDAVVTIGDVVQESGKPIDFSPLDPEDSEGRPVEYKVTAPNGDFRILIVQYILTN